MALDPNRAALVLNEYRYYTPADNVGLKSLYPNATEIVITTNLDADGATALGNSLASQCGVVARAFSFDIVGVLWPEDWMTSPQRYTLTFANHPASAGATYTLVSVKVQYGKGTATLTVRG